MNQIVPGGDAYRYLPVYIKERWPLEVYPGDGRTSTFFILRSRQLGLGMEEAIGSEYDTLVAEFNMLVSAGIDPWSTLGAK